MSTTKTIRPTRQSVDPMTGRQRWRLNRRDAATLLEYLEGDTSRIRGSRGVRKDGTIHFTTGCGYAIMDADLLGGNGDGRAERAFNDAGYSVRY